MKKRKHPGPDRHEFNNSPFTSLKKLTPAASPPIAAKPTAPKTPPDDQDLFLRVMSGTRRLNEDPGEETSLLPGDRPAPKQREEADQQEFLRAMTGIRRFDREPSPQAPAVPSKARGQKQHADDVSEEGNLFVQAVHQLGPGTRRPDPEDDIREEPRRSASGRMKQLRRGAIRISSELDLHGNLRDEALIRLRNFIAAAYSRGQKAVLVITGKGINSLDGPVLPGAVAQWLREEGRGMIAEFAQAPRDKGGTGAYVVFLKNPAAR